MTEKNNGSRNGGIGVFLILFFIFLVLKLTGYITWSWFWVTAPLWMPFSLFFIIFLAVVVLMAIFTSKD